MTFDSALNGWFAIGLKFGNDVGVYVFNTGSNLANGFTFASFNGNGLSHAALYDGADGPRIQCEGGSCVVPEPSTYALMTAGLIGIFGLARRRRDPQV
jgi:hypothetical protein